MDVENYETIDMPSRDEGERYLKTLRDRGILAANLDGLQTRMKLVELGITMPKGKEHWLLFDSAREKALYIFFRLHFPGRDRDQALSRLVVFRFDIARYQGNPLSPGFEAGDACYLFKRSVAIVAGLDLMKCTLGYHAHQLN